MGWRRHGPALHRRGCGHEANLAIIPAGTANLLATNLGIPKDIEQAVEIGLSGHARRIDVGRLNGERFAVMAGAGFDARMIGDADGSLKDRFGRLAYVWTGAKNLREKPFRAKIKVDGAPWYDGEASCILFGNVGELFGGVEAFEDANPDDGVLELGVLAADGVRELAGTVARAVVGTASKSPHVITTKVHSVRVKLDRKVLYEIDGGDRKRVRKLRVEVEPQAVQICVPRDGPLGLPGREVALEQRLERPFALRLRGAAPDAEAARCARPGRAPRPSCRTSRATTSRQSTSGRRTRAARASARQATPAARVLKSRITRRSRGCSGFLNGEQTIWNTRLVWRSPEADLRDVGVVHVASDE